MNNSMNKKIIPQAYRLLFFCALFGMPVTKADESLIIIGSGGSGGVFAPIVNSICADISLEKSTRNRCHPITTGGSMHNLLGVLSGELDVGLTMPALINDAYIGQGYFTSVGPQNQLRTVAALYSQPIGILVKKKSSIQELADFEGKSISIGPEGTGRREIANILFKYMGWSVDDFSGVYEYTTTEMTQAFCDDEVDILILVFGFPAAFYDEIQNECDAKFVSLPSQLIHEIHDKNKFYKKTFISSNMLINNEKPVYTLEMDVVFITRQDVPNKVIHTLLNTMFTEPDKVYGYHRAIESSYFSANEFFENASGAPLHRASSQFIKKTR
jgi:TRAP transporter TAXI family solute receptor